MTRHRTKSRAKHPRSLPKQTVAHPTSIHKRKASYKGLDKPEMPRKAIWIIAIFILLAIIMVIIFAI